MSLRLRSVDESNRFCLLRPRLALVPLLFSRPPGPGLEPHAVLAVVDHHERLAATIACSLLRCPMDQAADALMTSAGACTDRPKPMWNGRELVVVTPFGPAKRCLATSTYRARRRRPP